ncbi:SDR family oxidoreductase [Nocardioides sp.]|uniref:SDR family NAD(P)-dependent oxidoreductase n=1 Tax=Nocardioides sp. TaxID=35761 RepID=UPI00260707D1|nr:SDR family oxidoreductase [Nocardioides sp.]MCW2737963.1 putative oxidoreductase [Nocardioides sp.]
MSRLHGKVVAITGAAAGIGAAASRTFADNGARVVLGDIDVTALESLVDELRQSGFDVSGHRLDVTDEDSVAAFFEAVDDSHARLDALFNCAGGSASEDGPVHELTVDVVRRVLDLELLSVILCSRSAVPLLKRAGGGAVVNMTSYSAYRGTVQIHAYAAAKGAVGALTLSMAGAYATDGIRVNAIAPAAALSERAKRRLAEGNVASHLSFDWADYPFAMGPPQSVADIALFLLSDESRMLTGQVIMADGGLTAY